MHLIVQAQTLSEAVLDVKRDFGSQRLARTWSSFSPVCVGFKAAWLHVYALIHVCVCVRVCPEKVVCENLSQSV